MRTKYTEIISISHAADTTHSAHTAHVAQVAHIVHYSHIAHIAHAAHVAHVAHYLPICTSKTEISDGLTPLILLACPSVRGLMRASFSRDSWLSELIFE